MNAPVGPDGIATGPMVTPPPPELKAPWWATLVAIVLTAGVTAYFMMPKSAPRMPGLPGEIPGAGFAVDTIMYMPHIVLLFGVLADMFTYDGVWSIPSLVGVLSILFNYGMQYFWKGLQEFYYTAKGVSAVGSNPAPMVGTQVGGAVLPGSFFQKYDGCSVQGFESLKTEFAPQTLVITATVFCYFIFDIVRNRGWINGAASIVGFSAVYALQVGVIKMAGGCGGPYGDTAQAAMALFEGIVFGGSAYGIVQTYFPERLPSSTVSPFPRRSKRDLTTGPDGRMYDSAGNPYVILPNGQAVPDLSTAASRDAFAKIAGENLGTGLPAKPAACPA
jgi:hypothetical protein